MKKVMNKITKFYKKYYILITIVWIIRAKRLEKV